MKSIRAHKRHESVSRPLGAGRLEALRVTRALHVLGAVPVAISTKRQSLMSK